MNMMIRTIGQAYKMKIDYQLEIDLVLHNIIRQIKDVLEIRSNEGGEFYLSDSEKALLSEFIESLDIDTKRKK